MTRDKDTVPPICLAENNLEYNRLRWLVANMLDEKSPCWCAYWRQKIEAFMKGDLTAENYFSDLPVKKIVHKK